MRMRVAVTMLCGLWLSGCFLLKPADQKEAEQTAAPQVDASPTAEFRARFERIQGASAETAEALDALRREMFAARAAAAKSLGPRMTRQELVDAKPEERLAYSERRNAFRARWSDVSKMASAIRYRRASIFAGKGDSLGALRELAWPSKFGRGEEIIEACYSEGPACDQALAAVQKAYGALRVVQTEHVLANRGAGGSKSHVLVDLVVSSARPRGAGWTVKGRKYDPGKVRNCHGFYQTHEVIGVQPKSVTVRETTWCKKITYSLSKGLQVTYELDELPFELGERSRLRLLVPRDAIVCRDGAVQQCTVKGAEVIAADTKTEAWRSGGVVPLARAGRS